MTEGEWLGCESQYHLLEFLGSTTKPRKMRLFACACFRLAWHKIPQEEKRKVVEDAELYADRRISWLRLVLSRLKSNSGSTNTPHSMACAYLLVRNGESASVVGHIADICADGKYPMKKQADLLCCIFGNPFRPFTLAPAHRTVAIASLARAAYDERHLPSGELDPTRLAVLADALEEAGAPGDLVAHLRGPGPHVRGCFAVDTILGLS